MALRHHVGRRIRDLRRAADLTQEDLADRIGKAVQSISAIERGAYSPSFETIEAIAAVFNIGPAYLFPSAPMGKRKSGNDDHLAAITAGATQLSDGDAELVRVIIDALLTRKASSGTRPSRAKRVRTR